MDIRRQRQQAAAIEQRWSTLARREGKDNQRQAKRARTQGNFTMARFYDREARWDFMWARKRTRLARKYRAP